MQALTKAGAPSPAGSRLNFNLSNGTGDNRPGINGVVPTIHFNVPGGPDVFRPGQRFSGLTGRPGLPTGVSGSGNLPLTAAQKFAVARAANPNDLNLLRQQAQKDRNALAFALKLRNQSRISNAKYVQEYGAYQSDLQSTLSTIAAITASAAKKITDARHANIPGHVSGEAFGHFRFDNPRVPGTVRGSATGFGAGFRKMLPSFAPSLALQLAAAKAASTASPGDDLSVVRKIRKAAQAALKSGRLAVQGQIDAWNAIADANNQLSGNQKGDVTKFRHVSTSKLLAGIGLSPAEMRAARERLATRGPGGTVPQASGQFTHATIINIENLHSSAVNVKQLEDDIAKRARSRPQVRRGAR